MMKFPLDNQNRKTPGMKTAAIHDRTGRIVIQVLRVNLPRNMGESVGSWRERETRATVGRASALVRMMNAAAKMALDGTRPEQEYLLGFEQFADGIDAPDIDTAASTEVKKA